MNQTHIVGLAEIHILQQKLCRKRWGNRDPMLRVVECKGLLNGRLTINSIYIFCQHGLAKKVVIMIASRDRN